MSITTGQLITASDLNASHTSILSGLSADLPAVYWLNLDFNDVTATTSLARRTKHVIIPDDTILVEVCVSSGDLDGYLAVDVDNGAMIEPVELYETVSTGFDEMARWYVSTKTQAPAVQLLLFGSQLEVIVETLSTATPNTVHVSLGLVSEWRRT
jgi:hypothetical protein